MSGRQLFFEGRRINFVRRGTWEYVERRGVTGIVGIIAVTDDDELILIEQYRPPVNARVIELPAGLVGDRPGAEHEAMQAAARRELIEETGFDAASLVPVAEGVMSPGITDESITLFLATTLSKVGPGGGDGSENIVVHRVPLANVAGWLQDRSDEGALIDLKIHAALHLCRIHCTREAGEG